MKYSVSAVIAALLFAAPAFALDLQQARANGQVGEKADGYVAAVQASPEVNALVSEVNGRRRAEYERISKQNGQTPAVVGTLAAPQIRDGLPAGSKYQDASGKWQER